MKWTMSLCLNWVNNKTYSPIHYLIYWTRLLQLCIYSVPVHCTLGTADNMILHLRFLDHIFLALQGFGIWRCTLLYLCRKMIKSILYIICNITRIYFCSSLITMKCKYMARRSLQNVMHYKSSFNGSTHCYCLYGFIVGQPKWQVLCWANLCATRHLRIILTIITNLTDYKLASTGTYNIGHSIDIKWHHAKVAFHNVHLI